MSCIWVRDLPATQERYDSFIVSCTQVFVVYSYFLHNNIKKHIDLGYQEVIV